MANQQLLYLVYPSDCTCLSPRMWAIVMLTLRWWTPSIIASYNIYVTSHCIVGEFWTDSDPKATGSSRLVFACTVIGTSHRGRCVWWTGVWRLLLCPPRMPSPLIVLDCSFRFRSVWIPPKGPHMRHFLICFRFYSCTMWTRLKGFLFCPKLRPKYLLSQKNFPWTFRGVLYFELKYNGPNLYIFVNAAISTLLLSLIWHDLTSRQATFISLV